MWWKTSDSCFIIFLPLAFYVYVFGMFKQATKKTKWIFDALISAIVVYRLNLSLSVFFSPLPHSPTHPRTLPYTHRKSERERERKGGKRENVEEKDGECSIHKSTHLCQLFWSLIPPICSQPQTITVGNLRLIFVYSATEAWTSSRLFSVFSNNTPCLSVQKEAGRNKITMTSKHFIRNTCSFMLTKLHGNNAMHQIIKGEKSESDLSDSDCCSYCCCQMGWFE